MEYEQKVLKSFFKAIRSGNAKSYINGDIYKKLIYYRFEEALLATYPVFYSRISEKKWRKLVKAFIATETTTPFMWKMPKKFGRFVASKMKKPKYIKDLLWFEWIEVELMMAPYKKPKHKKVNFSKCYKISKSARVKRLSYPVMYGEFKPKGEYWIVIYQTSFGDVEWMEITPFMGELLKKCNCKKEISKIVEKVSKKYAIEVKDAKAVLEKGLKQLLKKGVLV